MSTDVLEEKVELHQVSEEPVSEIIYYKELGSYLHAKNIANNYINKIDSFYIEFNEDFIVKVLKLIRVLPGKRLVFLCENEKKKNLILKIYINPEKYQKEHLDIATKYNKLLLANINTPRIIYSGLDDLYKTSYFLYEYINSEGTYNYSDIKLLINTIADMHKNNLYQQDLHIDNFILNKNKVFCLDLASISVFNIKDKSEEQFFDVKISINKYMIENFSLFLAQLPSDYYENWDEFIDCYLENFDDKIDLRIKNHIENLAKDKLKIRLKKFTNKCLRDCTDFKRINKNSYAGVVKRSVYNKNSGFISEFIDGPQCFISKYSAGVIKDGNTAKVYFINYNGKKYIIKSYLSNNKLTQILNYFKSKVIKPRALNSWLNANLLEHIGVRTAEPIGYLINIENICLKDSYFIMEYLEDIVRLDVFFENKMNLIINESLLDYVDYLKKILIKFKFLNILHNDFKTVNLGIIDKKIAILDLDAMSFFNKKIIFNRSKNKDKIRLINSCNENRKIYDLLSEKLV